MRSRTTARGAMAKAFGLQPLSKWYTYLSPRAPCARLTARRPTEISFCITQPLRRLMESTVSVQGLPASRKARIRRPLNRSLALQSAEAPSLTLDTETELFRSRGGAIDPAGFLDADGKQYVLYKIDGNSIGHGGNCNNGVPPLVPTPIMLQEVNAQDGVTPIGAPVQIFDRGSADGPLVEAPSLVRVPDATSAGGWLYILFFSSNCYAGGQYDSSYATSSNGIKNGGKNYAKAGKPLLVTGTDGLYSPGGLDVGPGGLRVLFHADKGMSADVRPLWAGEISIDVPSRIVTI